jgi:hypothetical protein
MKQRLLAKQRTDATADLTHTNGTIMQLKRVKHVVHKLYMDN